MNKKKIYVLSAIFMIVVVLAVVFFTQKSSVSEDEQDLEYEDVAPEVIVGQAWFINASCEDSDGGLNWEDFGTVTLSFDDGNVREVSDDCINETYIVEMRCVNNGLRGARFACPDELICDGGVCIEEEPLCTDTDGGQNYYEKGHAVGLFNGLDYEAYDRCDGETGELYEVYCEGDNVRHEFVELPEGYICDEDLDYFVDYPGCTDSDGGQNHYEKGTTVGIYQNQDMTLMDRCLSGRLYEYYCEDEDYARQIVVDLPEGYTCDETEDIFVEI